MPELIETKFILNRNRQHLERCHKQSPYCPRCKAAFKTKAEQQAHCESREPCNASAKLPPEGTTEEQREMIRSKKRVGGDNLDSEKWNRIYSILFPDDDPKTIPSPCKSWKYYHGD
jgi:hypothetical protein